MQSTDHLRINATASPEELNELLLLVKPNTSFKERIVILCGFLLVLLLPFPGMAQILTNNPPAIPTNTSRALMTDGMVLRLWSGVTTQITAQVEPKAVSAIDDRLESFTNKLYRFRLGYDCSTSGFG